MSVDRDHVVLTPGELRALAGMERQARAADPALEARMVSGRPRRRLGRQPRMGHAALLLVVGIAVAVVTVGTSVWLALVGVIMMTVALEWMVAAGPTFALQARRWWRSAIG